MSMRDFSSMLPRMQPSVPGCPAATIVQYVRNSAIRVCERTLTWRHAEQPYPLTPGVHQYPYNKPANAEVHTIFLASINDSLLENLSLDDAIRLYPMWADLFGGVPYDQLWAGSGSFNEGSFNSSALNSGPQFQLPASALEKASEPRSITQLTPDQFIVLPLPDDAKQYNIRLIYALKPSRSATSIPTAIFDDLEDAIMHGALQELLVVPGMPWTDRELATYHAKQYVFHVGERRARANLGNTRGTLSVKIRPFA